MINYMLGSINITSSKIDYSFRNDIIDKYIEYFKHTEFELRNKINKAIDLILFFIVISTFVLFIIIGCFLHRENKMCEEGIYFCCCRINICDWCSCCCDFPSLNDASTNSLNNQSSSQGQQQNALSVRKHEDPTPRINNSNNGDNVGDG
jgi:hypothetical protein